MKITAIQCLECGDTVFSRCRHDCRSCSCENIYIDGGRDYTKVSFHSKNYKMLELDLEVTDQELYNDWNKKIDKYGIIKSDLNEQCKEEK